MPDAYKAEEPGTDSDLNAYDVVYYAGDCNAGSKTIAINLPNDETVQLAKGTRRVQLKNAMRAKFDNILAPIADELIAADQRRHVVFDAFFANTMFHEVAHGLGIKNTLNDKGLVDTFARIAKVRGTAVARAEGERCTVCQVRLRPAVFVNVLKNDQIVQCDSCNRILYFIAPQAPKAPEAPPAS